MRCNGSAGFAFIAAPRAARPRYRAAAQELGQCLAAAGIELVFGGGHIGLMGVLADAVLAAGGPGHRHHPGEAARRRVGASRPSELVVIGTMHDRKRMMAERADAFAILPGGIGTLDETFEIAHLAPAGLHDKPIYLVDVAGYWRPLVALFDHLVAEQFARSIIPNLVQPVAGIAALMDAISAGVPG